MVNTRPAGNPFCFGLNRYYVCDLQELNGAKPSCDQGTYSHGN